MTTTVKQAQLHIASLIAQDQRDADVVNNYYDKALSVIKSSLQAFFVEYATDTGLSINDVSQRASQWDLDQLDQAIDLLNVDNQNTDLKRRLLAARLTANQSHRDALASIVTASIAIATAQTASYGNQTAKQSYVNEYNYRATPGQMMSQVNLPKDVAKQADFNSRVWVHGDASTLATKQTLDKAFKSGIDQAKLKQLLADNHGNQRVDNIDSSAQTGISFNKQLVRFTNITATNQGRDAAYKADPNTDYVKFLTEEDDKVCDICEPLDGQVYALSDAPIPQDDTHLNCRCSLERCDSDGNLM